MNQKLEQVIIQPDPGTGIKQIRNYTIQNRNK